MSTIAWLKPALADGPEAALETDDNVVQIPGRSRRRLTWHSTKPMSRGRG